VAARFEEKYRTERLVHERSAEFPRQEQIVPSVWKRREQYVQCLLSRKCTHPAPSLT
jgi:hypothetical protein